MSAPWSNRLRRRAGWRVNPPDIPTRRPTYEAAVVAVLVAWNLIANLLESEVVSFLVAAISVAVLLVLARRASVSAADLGLNRDSIGKGIRVGAVAAAAVLVATTVLAVLPPSREFFADDRFIGVGALEMLYDTLFRIPIGTALMEEIAFRGVVLGMLLQWMTPGRATMISSILFGLWHVLPGLDAIESNPAGDLLVGPATAVAGVAFQVVVTGLTGAVFAWLRFRADSIVAPIMVHWGLNGAAYATGWLVVTNGWS